MAIQKENILTEVMDTIANLNDSKGSSADKILDRIIYRRRSPLKNASIRVKKALKTGLKHGLIREVGGKFKLGLGTTSYAAYKNFKGRLPIKELRRRGGRRRGRRRSKRRRRGRRRNESFDMDCLNLDEDIAKTLSLRNLAKGDTLPVKELRRRGRSRKRRRRKRGRRRNDIFNLEELDMESDTSAEPMDRGRRRRGRNKRKRRRRGRRRALEDEDESSKSTESKEASRNPSEEKPKAAKSTMLDTQLLNEMRDLEEQRNCMDENDISDHYIHHDFHHDLNHYGHPHPHPDHFGRGYYD